MCIRSERSIVTQYSIAQRHPAHRARTKYNREFRQEEHTNKFYFVKNHCNMKVER